MRFLSVLTHTFPLRRHTAPLARTLCTRNHHTPINTHHQRTSHITHHTLGDDFRKMSVYSAFLLACGCTLMRQSTAPLQNFAHFLREDGPGDFFDVSPAHYFYVLLLAGTYLFGACLARGVKGYRWLLGDDLSRVLFFRASCIRQSLARCQFCSVSSPEEYRKLYFPRAVLLGPGHFSTYTTPHRTAPPHHTPHTTHHTPPNLPHTPHHTTHTTHTPHTTHNTPPTHTVQVPPCLPLTA